MQKKIFRVMTVMSATVLLIFALIMASITYTSDKNNAENALKNAANLIIQQDLDVEKIDEYLKNALPYDVRLTYVNNEGRVIYDNQADKSEMGNHLDRKEIEQARKNNIGEATRFSETLGKSTYYYAVKYGDGILRFSRNRSSLLSFFLTVFPIIICLTGALIVITTVISIKLSESIIKPLNDVVEKIGLSDKNIEFSEPEYEELKPIVKNASVLLKSMNKNVERLKREKEKITLITDNMVEGMILLDSDFTVLSVNRSAAKLLNSYFNPKSHEHISKLTSNEQILGLLNDLDQDDSARGIVTIKGRHFRVFVNKSDLNGQFGIIILLVDVTESIQSEEIRRDFSANVSHELKTPLTTIKGFGEMMENGIITDSEDVKKYGGTIYRESERLLFLINDIIRLSEIEEQVNVEAQKIDLLAIANDTKEILNDKAHKHEISVEVSGYPVIIQGNSSYITELLLNLTDNAIKYNNRGGKVWISISKTESQGVISVKDNGIGIKESDQKRIFERFYRVDKSRSKETGGTGLGLSIVKHIVAYHGGEINIKSKLNEGTNITVFLPLKK